MNHDPSTTTSLTASGASRYAIGLFRHERYRCVFSSERARAHFFGALPFLLLVCPLMHVFMHHGHGRHGGGHGGHDGREQGTKPAHVQNRRTSMTHDAPGTWAVTLVVPQLAIFLMFAFSFFAAVRATGAPSCLRGHRRFFVEMYGFPLSIYLMSGFGCKRSILASTSCRNNTRVTLWSTLLGE